MTVTATQTGTGTHNGTGIAVRVLTGAKPPAQQTGATFTTNTSPSFDALTPVAVGSQIYTAIVSYAGSGALTFEPGQTVLYATGDVTNAQSPGFAKLTALTPSLSPVTVGCSAGPGANWHFAACEILGATSGSLAEDGSTPAAVYTPSAIFATSPSFTPPYGSLLVALALSGTSGVGTQGMQITDTLGLTWTRLVINPGSFPNTGVWVASAPSAPFPDSPLGHRLEVQLNGAWTDLTSRLEHGPAVIGRGHPDESTTVAPSTMDAVLANTDAAVSPDNATSPYSPYLVQNVPCRVSIPEGASYLRSETDTTSGAAASLPVTAGDIDVTADMTLDNGWTQGTRIAGQWVTASNHRSWTLGLNGDGTLSFARSTDGTAATYAEAVSTVPVVAPPSRRLTVRATHDHTTGTVTFYTGGVQLGAAVVLGAGSLFALAGLTCDAGNPVNDGDTVTLGRWPGYQGKYHSLQVRSVIGGTLLGSPDFTTVPAGTTSFADTQANTWTLTGTAEVSDRSYRFHGELAEFGQDEPAVNPAGGTPDVTTTVQAGGLLRRYSQRNAPVKSAMYRALTLMTANPPFVYWPMEDSAGSSQLASATGGPAMLITSGTPQLASNSDFAGSNPLPVLNGAELRGGIPAGGTWTDIVYRFALEVPAGGEPNGAIIAAVHTTGTISRAELVYGTGGTLTLNLYDNLFGALITSAGPLTPFGSGGVNGQKLRAAINLQKSGGGTTITYWIEVRRVDGTGAQTSASATTGGTVGNASQVVINRLGILTGTVAGHASVQALYQPMTDIGNSPLGWAGEAAGTRLARLCAEEGIQFRSRGNLADTTLMGVQRPATLAQLAQSCADADMGVWTELRQALGWGYVTRKALYSQAAQLALDYGQDYLSMWPSAPKRDDQVTVNDVTYVNANGSSARAYAAPGQPVTGGRLSTQNPPNGVGTYDQSYSVAINSDADLAGLASWRLHLGTADQSRFPGIGLDMSNRAAASLRSAALALDLGDRVTVANPPPWLGWDTVTQLAQEITETIGAYDWDISVAGVPELPYQVAREGAAHADTDGSAVHSGGWTSGATSVLVDVTAGNLWTTSAGDFPFDVMVGGERMTVTNITGSSSPQTFTVTRSVNRVVKAHLAGEAVNVWPPPVAGL